MNITIYSFSDAGLPKADATRLFQALARHIVPHHVQVIRPVILKGRATTTTLTMRAFKLKDLDDLVQNRLINPKRSLMSNWITLARLIEAFKIKESKNV